MDLGDARKLICPECQLSKLNRKRAPVESITRADQALYRIHADLSGRKLSSLAGFRYYLLLTDDYSRYRWVFLLRQKSDAPNEIISFLRLVEREKPTLKVAFFRSDGGGEFDNQTLSAFLKEIGVTRETSAPYSQFQNGVAERSIGIVDDAARTLLCYAGAPVYDWCHAVEHAVHVQNRLPSRALDGRKPIALYTGVERPLRSDMPVFGCLGYAKIYVRGKQENKARRVVFLSAGDHMKGDRVRDITSFHSSLSEYFCRDVVYDIRQYPYKSRLVPRPPHPALDADDIKEALRLQELSKKSQEANEVQVHDSELKADGSEGWEVERIIDKRPSRFGPRHLAFGTKGYDYRVVWRPEGLYPDSWEPESHLQECSDAVQRYEQSQERVSLEEKSVPSSSAPRRSTRLNPASATVVLDVARGLSNDTKTVLQAGSTISQDAVLSLYQPDPQTRSQALASIHCDEWLAAEQDELKSIAEHCVWTLVDPEPHMNILGCRFVYKVKRQPDGTVEKFKVRLVAQGFKQKEGVDYAEIFATTAAFQAIRMVLWLATFYSMQFWKLDIKTFFLYGDLQEKIYMKQPPGYEVGNKVCALTKSLYGLKQSMRCALKALSDQLALQQIFPLMTDQNTFFRKDQDGVVILFAWVDDLGLCCSSEALAQKVVSSLEEKFQVTVDKNPSHYLQLEFSRDKNKRQMKVSQTSYITQLLCNHQMVDCNSLKIPFTAQNDLPSPKLVEKNDSVPYMELVGSLIWLLKTRPDLGIYVSILTRYMNRYDEHVFQYALRVLRYLAHTKDYGLVYDESSSPVCDYGKGVHLSFEVDSEWGGRTDDSKSTTGWIVKANNSSVYSGSLIQKRVATSTTEAESNGLEYICKEAQWYRDFLNELQIDVSYAFPTFQDNKGALTLTEDPKNRQRTKYFRISQHFIRSQRIFGKLEFLHRDGKLLDCDMLTKPLFFPDLSRCRDGLMGDQNVLKKSSVGKEFSSDYTGDGPARTKRVSRLTPLQIRNKVKKARQKSNSMSTHVPPLYAVCPGCHKFLKWEVLRFDWRSCNRCFLPYCEQCQRIICVACSECDSVAERVESLDHWFCPNCITRDVPARAPPRARRFPRRYRP